MSDPRLFDRRPNEVTVRLNGHRRAIVAVAEDADSRGRPMLHGLEGGAVYVFSARVGEAIVRDYPEVELVHEGRGALPLTWAPDANTRQAHIWANGPRERSHAERVADLRQRFALEHDELADAAVRLIDAGLDEQDAAQRVRDEYARAIDEQRAYRMWGGWRAWADELIASPDRAHEAAEA
jgi:hypothetical protein